MVFQVNPSADLSSLVKQPSIFFSSVSVSVYVALPYRKTDCTVERNSVVFVFLYVDLQCWYIWCLIIIDEEKHCIYRTHDLTFWFFLDALKPLSAVLYLINYWLNISYHSHPCCVRLIDVCFNDEKYMHSRHIISI